ncbi:NRPS condensation-like uncharacterized protein/acyl carrier protein [Croceifilum oryzae]|uniref:NRPS condensation-like uncharacterized protein/acyl carrier protein n=1 Tax=Croceifilum oryzae TaxID=1553429 RepID=A0AAJ1WRL1_9BACL|nr:condensation domain-containing protein [Croceifilum oryzae]MDQ0416438.1 NRPS condensation-like uncharacterized protein/acyl carrier protein [Croceifilum oryzae]
MFDKNNIEDMYYLSPMQTGLLYHFLLDERSYFVQMNLAIHGNIKAAIFSKSFQMLVDRHHILRTVFIHEKLARPLQVVWKQQKARVEWMDMTHLSEEEKEVHVQQIRREDKEKVFQLSEELPMRMTVIQTDSDSYQLIWSFHHILMDGWCLDILIGDFCAIYESLLYNKPVKLERPFPYSQYIKWIENQDMEAAFDYWRTRLEGYEQKAVVYKKQDSQLGAVEEKAEMMEQDFTIDRDLSDRLSSVAKKAGVTLNHVIQSILGIVLQRYNQVEDVVFGSVISGRPPEIEGVEQILGLFINTVPVRIQTDQGQTFTDLICNVHKMDVDSKPYEHASLSEVQNFTPLKQDLFEVIYNFRNFQNTSLETADVEQEDDQGIGFTLHPEKHHDQYHYDFSFAVSSGQEINITITYHDGLYDKEIIERFMQHFTGIVEQVANNPGVLIADIEMIPPYLVKMKALPIPEPLVQARSYVRPTNEMETRLVAIWQEVLGVDRVGIEDNFFDLGGQSLKAMKLVAKIQKEFDMDFPLSTLFQAQTIQAVAWWMSEGNSALDEQSRKKELVIV